MARQKSAVRKARAATGVVFATVLFAAPASAAPTTSFAHGVLTITGDAGNKAW